MPETIFSLTSRGQRELTARRGSLAPELGSLLVLVDGRRTRADLLATLGRAGNMAASLRWLAQAGYIEPVAPPAPPPTAPQPAASTADEDVARRFRIVSSFLTDAVKQHLGLRGFTQQLRIERASTLEDLAERVEPLADAIGRATDRRTANDFVEQARALLEPVCDGPDA